MRRIWIQPLTRQRALMKGMKCVRREEGRGMRREGTGTGISRGRDMDETEGLEGELKEGQRELTQRKYRSK